MVRNSTTIWIIVCVIIFIVAMTILFYRLFNEEGKKWGEWVIWVCIGFIILSITVLAIVLIYDKGGKGYYVDPDEGGTYEPVAEEERISSTPDRERQPLMPERPSSSGGGDSLGMGDVTTPIMDAPESTLYAISDIDSFVGDEITPPPLARQDTGTQFSPPSLSFQEIDTEIPRRGPTLTRGISTQVSPPPEFPPPSAREMETQVSPPSSVSYSDMATEPAFRQSAREIATQVSSASSTPPRVVSFNDMATEADLPLPRTPPPSAREFGTQYTPPPLPRESASQTSVISTRRRATQTTPPSPPPPPPSMAEAESQTVIHSTRRRSTQTIPPTLRDRGAQTPRSPVVRRSNLGVQVGPSGAELGTQTEPLPTSPPPPVQRSEFGVQAEVSPPIAPPVQRSEFGVQAEVSPIRISDFGTQAGTSLFSPQRPEFGTQTEISPLPDLRDFGTPPPPFPETGDREACLRGIVSAEREERAVVSNKEDCLKHILQATGEIEAKDKCYKRIIGDDRKDRNCYKFIVKASNGGPLQGTS